MDGRLQGVTPVWHPDDSRRRAAVDTPSGLQSWPTPAADTTGQHPTTGTLPAEVSDTRSIPHMLRNRENLTSWFLE